MDEPPLNPSQQVERIREILIGRQLHQVEDRLRQLENTLDSQGQGTNLGDDVLRRMESSQAAVLEETQQLRQQLQQETQLRNSQIDRLTQQLETTCRDLHRHDQHLQKNLSSHLENISSAMAARIDARVREILHHLQSEITQWKHQVDRDVQSVRDDSVSRGELKSRFARLASAAMEDDPKPADSDGFLL